MTSHNTESIHHTPSEVIQHGIDFVRNHPRGFALGTIALLAFGGGNTLLAEDAKNYACEPSGETITAKADDTISGLAVTLYPDVSPEVGEYRLREVNPALADPGYILQIDDTLSVAVCGDDIPKR